jgi:hypothetical protein
MAADPGRLELLWLLRGELDDAVLESMATYDGGMAQQANHQALSEILRTGEVPSPLPPDPGEICNLMRWETFDPAKPLAPQKRRHQIMRLFSTWILLNAYTRPKTDRMGYDEDGDEIALLNLAQISLALGPDYIRASLRFVRWAQSAGPAAHDPVEDLFYRLTVLVLLCASPDAADLQAAPAAYESLEAAERQVRCQVSAKPSGYWPLRLARLFGLYDGALDGLAPGRRRRKWVKTAAWVLDRLESSGPGPLPPSLLDFRRRFLGAPSHLP